MKGAITTLKAIYDSIKTKN